MDSRARGGDSGPTGDGERREGPRIPIEMWVEETTDSERYFRRAGNLSRGGLGLDHTIPLPLGTVVNLTFTLPGDSNAVKIAGEIVSTMGPEELRMGVKFIGMTDEARARIDAYLARVGVSV
ncbi:MAG TPA: PilZ domain-containing protein [Polyangia bacterium]|nr:PilZ domain-containing protein [Polyangia bacterium]